LASVITAMPDESALAMMRVATGTKSMSIVRRSSTSIGCIMLKSANACSATGFAVR